MSERTGFDETGIGGAPRGIAVLARLDAAPDRTYRPIGEYGAIGDGRSVALISAQGSLDWWSPARFDAPSMFAAILDSERGGRWLVAPVGAFTSTMRYIEQTNVLMTEHTSDAQGRVRVTDLAVHEADSGTSDSVILRRIEGLAGRVAMETVFAPRYQYGRVIPRFSTVPVGLLAAGAGETALLVSHLSWGRPSRGVRRARFEVGAGERVDLVLRHVPFATSVPFVDPLPDGGTLERATCARWREWSGRTCIDGPDAALVRRSALALKLLQFERNGALVAAATTSIPEAIGGIRNWDYRYVWVRDGVITARALAVLGHEEEAERFAMWLRSAIGGNVDEMRIMYTISGSRDMPERELPHLEGYRRSAPVRIGNGAATQRQLDVYGELVEFLHHTGDRAAWPLVRGTAEWVCERWREPDQGIWEMRCPPRHFVLSKAMAWVALDRATRFAQEIGEVAPTRWRIEADAVRTETIERGYDGSRRSFVQAYDRPELDASNLLLPLIGFIDARDPRMMATVERTLEELTVDGLVYRYLGSDGLPGAENAFAYCTFWLVEVLAAQGRVAQARALFDRHARRATPLALYAEEIDAVTGEHLGNFPQAFPHAGLIQAALALRRAETG